MIELGKSIDEKTYILDIKVLLNDKTIIHLEMQVINQHDWLDRSPSYLCRSFDRLEHGKAYQLAKPVIQIGLLNFTLFPEHPEFYATYQFTKEGRLYQIDYWAALLDY